MRFEFGGAAGEMQLAAPSAGAMLEVRQDDLRVHIAVPYVQWGDATGRWETSREKATSCADVVLYHGEERSINLAELQTAAIGLAVQLAAVDEAVGSPTAAVRDGRLELNWGELELSVPGKPGKVAELQMAAK